MISLRTLGTSEKKKSANIPATAPNEAAVTPLRERGSVRFCPGWGFAVGGKGREDKGGLQF